MKRAWKRLIAPAFAVMLLPLANPVAQAQQQVDANFTNEVCVTPTVTASNAYGTNYVVGGKLTFANAFTQQRTGVLESVSVTIKDNETGGFTFYPFLSNPSNTTWTDAAVAAINAADVPKSRLAVALTANSQLASSGVTTLYATGIAFAAQPASTTLYGVLLSNAALSTNFAAASDVQVCVQVMNDP